MSSKASFILLQYHSNRISCSYNVSAYQFISIQYKCCFLIHFILSSVFQMYIFIYLWVYCIRFHVFSIFTQILQLKNEFMIIDGS